MWGSRIVFGVWHTYHIIWNWVRWRFLYRAKHHSDFPMADKASMKRLGDFLSLRFALTNVAVCRGREWLVDAYYWHEELTITSGVDYNHLKRCGVDYNHLPKKYEITFKHSCVMYPILVEVSGWQSKVSLWLTKQGVFKAWHWFIRDLVIFNHWNLLLRLSQSVVEGNGLSMRIIDTPMHDVRIYRGAAAAI